MSIMTCWYCTVIISVCVCDFNALVDNDEKNGCLVLLDIFFWKRNGPLRSCFFILEPTPQKR